MCRPYLPLGTIIWRRLMEAGAALCESISLPPVAAVVVVFSRFGEAQLASSKVTDSASGMTTAVFTPLSLANGVAP